ncbi:MAG: thiopeptide-type bacteriocin biosynthesis protein [Acidimicrobiales bacterium]|jgi:thiopeptide-type bacteriocin biosynthesis protein|nr:thiopeptide-type bacteriocin biosynthesis protein [Acidimicrobiales bacterium]
MSGEPVDPDEIAHRLRVEADRAAARWTQLDLGLAGPPSATLAAALGELVAGLRADGSLDGWFLVRKPPGLRLRLRAAPGHEPQVERCLERIRGWSGIAVVHRGVYEPEEDRFGGPTGMVLAHHHFEADSDAVVANLALHPTEVPAPVLATVLADDLFSRAVDDGAELADVWARLAQAATAVAGTVTPTREERRAARVALEAPADAIVPAALHPELRRVQLVGDELAATLRDPSTAPAVGRRTWLATLATFLANRHGLDARALAGLAAASVAVLHPERAT